VSQSLENGQMFFDVVLMQEVALKLSFLGG
jgi:hypothetical protein